jgi:hypothetical protein
LLADDDTRYTPKNISEEDTTCNTCKLSFPNAIAKAVAKTGCK